LRVRDVKRRPVTLPLIPELPDRLPPWVFGLRPQVNLKAGGKRWQEVVALLVLGDLHLVPPSETTTAAETGLGIPPSWYWYVARTETAFGRTLSFWSTAVDPWLADERGVCPFDTGGLWHGFIKTKPPLANGAKKKELFGRYDLILSGWGPKFHLYLRESYTAPEDYVHGQCPTKRLPEILPVPENSSRAWTWEARVRRDATKGRVLLERLYCLEEDKLAFLEWLVEEASFDLPAKKAITSWIEEHAVLCSHADLPWQRGQRDLLEFFGPA
jgi:hypothetical protein